MLEAHVGNSALSLHLSTWGGMRQSVCSLRGMRDERERERESLSPGWATRSDDDSHRRDDGWGGGNKEEKEADDGKKDSRMLDTARYKISQN